MTAVPRLDNANLSFDRYDANAPFAIDVDATNYNSGTDELEVVVGPGRARWPDEGDVEYELTADQSTFTLASPAASTTYHVYIDLNAGSPTVVVNTDAPPGATADLTYLGSVTTDSDTSVLSTDDGRGLLPVRTRGVPAGSLNPFAGPDSNVPTGWLVADGSAVSRTTYAALFAAIGTTWGAGDGSTTFELPDMRDRFPWGAGQGEEVGEYGGLSTHDHTQGNTGIDGNHEHAVGDTGIDGFHGHTMPDTGSGGFHDHFVFDNTDDVLGSGGTLEFADPNHDHGNTSDAGSHTHAVPNADGNGNHDHGVPNTTTTGDHAHTNPTVDSASFIPPFAGVLWIIKT